MSHADIDSESVIYSDIARVISQHIIIIDVKRCQMLEAEAKIKEAKPKQL